MIKLILLIITSSALILYGYTLGRNQYTPIQSIISTVDYVLTREIIISSLFITLGWYVTSKQNRNLQIELFNLDKKYKISQSLVGQLSDYNSKIVATKGHIRKIYLELDYYPKVNEERLTNDIIKITELYYEAVISYSKLLELFNTYDNLLESFYSERAKLADSVDRLNLSSSLIFSNWNLSKFKKEKDYLSEFKEQLKSVETKLENHLKLIKKANEKIQLVLTGNIFKSIDWYS